MPSRHSQPLASGARIVFLGSPEFAVPTLRALAERFQVVEVITQPDRQAGRGRRMQEPPVKQAARELGLPVWQPERLRGVAAEEHLAGLGADCAVVVAYGEMLRPSLLALLPRGFVNVHASLLPAYRGASPIAAALLAGDDYTGVSVMLLDEGMDTGPVLAQERIDILPQESRGELEVRLSHLGAEALVRVLPGWLAGDVRPQPQDDSGASTTERLVRQDGLMDWGRPAAYLERLCRAMDPWPGAYTTWDGKTLKIRRAEAVSCGGSADPGLVSETAEGPVVGTAGGCLRLVTVQPEGRPAMSAVEFVRGRPHFVGARLGAG